MLPPFCTIFDLTLSALRLRGDVVGLAGDQLAGLGGWVRGSQVLPNMLAHSARVVAALRAPSHEIRCCMISRLGGHDKATRTTAHDIAECTRHIHEQYMQSWCRCSEFDGYG